MPTRGHGKKRSGLGPQDEDALEERERKYLEMKDGHDPFMEKVQTAHAENHRKNFVKSKCLEGWKHVHKEQVMWREQEALRLEALRSEIEVEVQKKLAIRQ